ncbi:hypothetical protein KGY77_07000 [Candidatus Bipolaricaulota bacterium]|nr:hypothetical protein [Candidatus Bipolaricaulota bacterium]
MLGRDGIGTAGVVETAFLSGEQLKSIKVRIIELEQGGSRWLKEKEEKAVTSLPVREGNAFVHPVGTPWIIRPANLATRGNAPSAE